VSENLATTTSTDLEFEEAIVALESQIQDLKTRHDRVTLAEREIIVLERERNQIKHQGKHRQDPAIKTELTAIEEKIEELNLVLESRLVDLWEPFWMAVRFGGLGVAIGWAIATFVK
jgi:predicted RNase H-like nuclease (RuvC/YqgF family)